MSNGPPLCECLPEEWRGKAENAQWQDLIPYQTQSSLRRMGCHAFDRRRKGRVWGREFVSDSAREEDRIGGART